MSAKCVSHFVSNEVLLLVYLTTIINCTYCTTLNSRRVNGEFERTRDETVVDNVMKTYMEWRYSSTILDLGSRWR
jgi:hypothetical protein